ncbi:MAG: glycosyl transferase [Thermodesulfobacteriota bacterium]
MVDFHQNGILPTIHGLFEHFDRSDYLARLENQLEEYGLRNPIGLVLPCHYSEIQNGAVMDRILDALRQIRYLHSVVIALGGADEEAQFLRARQYFGSLRGHVKDLKVLWMEGPRVQALLSEIREHEIQTGTRGKGQSVWMALGYLFSKELCEVIAVHDCDIVNYDRLLLGRLAAPTANIHNVFEFSKGYYPRISESDRSLKGRVSRLLLTPLVDTLRSVMADRGLRDLDHFFTYHAAFKYPLAGEVSFSARLARSLDMVCDWALEVATLSEVYHRANRRKIVQIALTSNYEHKHQDLSVEDASKGLHRMAADIGKFFFIYLRSHGFPLDDSFVGMIRHTYYDNARRFIKIYGDDAEMNGLNYDRHQEELTVGYFRDFLEEAWEQCKENPNGTLIPSWNRVLFSFPEIYGKIGMAVEEDNARKAQVWTEDRASRPRGMEDVKRHENR